MMQVPYYSMFAWTCPMCESSNYRQNRPRRGQLATCRQCQGQVAMGDREAY